jgi:hypothetical protein
LELHLVRYMFYSSFTNTLILFLNVTGQSCAFECIPGYTPIGLPTCNLGSWTLNGANCRKIEQCGVPSVVNGYYNPTNWVSAQNNTELDATLVMCNDGYTKNPLSNPICQCAVSSSDPCEELDGWCSPISCPNKIVNGAGTTASADCTFMDDAAYAVNAPSCTYTCGDGFYIGAASASTTCNIDGTWPSPPSCVEYICPAISETPDGAIAGATCDPIGASLTPSCTFSLYLSISISLTHSLSHTH